MRKVMYKVFVYDNFPDCVVQVLESSNLEASIAFASYLFVNSKKDVDVCTTDCDHVVVRYFSEHI